MELFLRCLNIRQEVEWALSIERVEDSTSPDLSYVWIPTTSTQHKLEEVEVVLGGKSICKTSIIGIKIGVKSIMLTLKIGDLKTLITVHRGINDAAHGRFSPNPPNLESDRKFADEIPDD